MSPRGCALALAASVGLAPGAVASAPAVECQQVADFARATVGEFPAAWRPREDKAREIYRILEEGGVRFVRATADRAGIQMGKEFAWDLATHPVLAWRWRPWVFPTGADEREAARNDSALGVYAVFPHSPVTVKTLKYVWSLTVPVGTTASASAGLTRMIVLRSGPAVDGDWADEAVDVPQDYHRLFGDSPARPRGIAILTDADQTKSRAVGDYAAFRVCPASAR